MRRTTNFIFAEILNLAVGYLAGFIASNLVARFFVKRGIANLWGLASKKEAVGKDTYEWLMFFSAYLIGLLVMLAVNRIMKRLNPAHEAAK